MPSPDQQQRLAALRETIADIERKPALAEARVQVRDESAGFPLPAGGLLQEVFTDERRHAGAVLGFALAQARSLLSQQRPAVIYLQLVKDAQEMGLPYGPGMVSFGFAPDALVLVRAVTMVELLWAAEEALACKAVAAVVADIAGHQKILDFTASRRLGLRAASAGSSIFLLRYGTGREASAAHLRWRLTPMPSARKRFDPFAPGAPRWRAQLEKGTLLKQQTEWLLGWTQDGFTTHNAARRPANRIAAGAPFSGAVPARLADRLSETA
jgi:protein ImuA